ncbi:MAG: porin [Phycisphaerales bacterium]
MDGLRTTLLSLSLMASITPHTIAGDTDTSLSLRQQIIADAGEYDSLITSRSAVTIDPIAFVQFRYIADVQDQQDTQDELTVGFVNSRTRVGLKGNLAEPNMDFFMWFGFTGSGASILLDAWMNWHIDENFSLKAGQFKLHTWNEWTVSETKQTFIERSVLDARFASLYGQGVEATWKNDSVKLVGSFNDGLRSWNDSSPGNKWAASARAEFMLEGDWSQRADFNSFRDEDPFMMLGVAGHIQDGDTLAGAGGSSIYTNDTKIAQWTADFQWGLGGSAVYAAVIGNYEERPGGTEYDQYGALIQGQVFITDDIELFARYEWGDLDGQAAAFAVSNPGATTEDTLSVLTVGATKYYAGHAMKFTADAGVAFDEVSGAWGGGGRGWQGDDAGANSQFVFRAQMQAIF